MIARRLRVPSLRRALSTGSGRIGIFLLGTTLAVAVFGPLVASDPPDVSVGLPFEGPSSGHLLGLDYLGRDVLSRFLWGGRSVLGLSTAATILGLVGGLAIGLTAAYRRGWVDSGLMRLTDVALAFPGLLLALLIVATAGRSAGLIIAAVGFHHAVRMARVVRAAALEVVVLPHVEVAEARGESVAWILRGEVMPSIWSPVLTDLGFRFIYAVIGIASLSFLGFGVQPPAADWGLMIAENRRGLNLNLWPVIVPALALAALTIAVSLLADAYARVLGRPADAGKVPL